MPPSNISFSICIPNYNYSRYIGETIQSVLNQTYQNFEIIVADNASTDNSIEVVQSFNDERIRVVKNRYNIGFAPNLQRATMYASNDYINVLSSDDIMKPTALETYIQVLIQQGNRANNTVLMSQAEIIDSAGRSIGLVQRSPKSFDLVSVMHPPRRRQIDKPSWELHRGHEILKESLATLRTFAPFLSLVYPRTLWEAVEGYNSVRTVGPDKHFNYKLLALDPDVIYVQEPLFGYRMHQSPNQQAQVSTLKQQIDDYLYTLEIPDELLRSLGLSRQDLVTSLLDRVCLKNGLTQLVYGSYTHAFRMLAFSLASYPKETLHRPRAYALALLLLMGPLSRTLARPLYDLYRRKHSPFGEADL